MSTILFAVGVSVAMAWTSTLQASDWYTINDTVMGGVSASTIRAGDDGGVVFSGELSLDNNGGFTSTRTEAVDADWRKAGALQLTVKGDGRTYIATIRLRDRTMRRIYYRAAFSTTEDTTTEVVLPLSDFDAYAFGRRIPQAPPLRTQLSRVGAVGIMLADKQPGSFSLEITGLQTVPRAEGEPAEAPGDPAAIQAVFVQAIEQGVPLFNGGEPQRCADVYQSAISHVLLLAPDQIDASTRLVLTEALDKGRKEADAAARAWIYRHAMDWTLANTAQ